MLPRSLRSPRTLTRCPIRASSTQVASKPLRILFCGSDDFSIYSLKALQAERQSNHSVIDSLDVLYRPAKQTGRGLKETRHVPIEAVAQDLGLTQHVVDTFRRWEAPSYINMIIAVSFGLLIPRRIIEGCEFGGLNVHPSLLPDLRGAAPIHHTLIRNRKHTGVTVQTLHPTKFDHGQVLAQTSSQDFPVTDDTTVDSLTSSLGQAGADLLMRTIRDGRYLNPNCASAGLTDTEIMELTNGKGPQLAPKIMPGDRMIRWGEQSADQILQRQKVLGEMWNSSLYRGLLLQALAQAQTHGSSPSSPLDQNDSASSIPDVELQKRLIFDQLERYEGAIAEYASDLMPGGARFLDGRLLIKTQDGVVLSSTRFTLEGGARGNGVQDLTKALRKDVKRVRKEAARMSKPS